MDKRLGFGYIVEQRFEFRLSVGKKRYLVVVRQCGPGQIVSELYLQYAFGIEVGYGGIAHILVFLYEPFQLTFSFARYHALRPLVSAEKDIEDKPYDGHEHQYGNPCQRFYGIAFF